MPHLKAPTLRHGLAFSSPKHNCTKIGVLQLLLYSSILRPSVLLRTVEAFAMSSRYPTRLTRVTLMTLLVLAACISPSFAQKHNQGKIMGGYFEEWSIYYA